MYICLGPLKNAFIQYCRHLVGLDGCHLKGSFGGQLLAVVGVDAIMVCTQLLGQLWSLKQLNHGSGF